MKVAILYICTGKYNQFFKGFFESCEKYLLKDIAQLEYYVFTDDMSLSDEANVHLIKKECAGFPADSLFRFDMFLQVRQELEKTDYIYFFNSNAEFKAPVGKELLPLNGEKLVGAEWPASVSLSSIWHFIPTNVTSIHRRIYLPGKTSHISIIWVE